MHPLVYPRHTKVAKLEYDWDGYSTVVMFSTKDDVEVVQEWYRGRDLKLDGDFDQYNFFSDDSRSKKVAEVLFACDKFTFEDLSSYVGSEKLDRMIAAKPKTIGVVFIVNDE